MTAICCPPAELASGRTRPDGIDLSHFIHSADDGTCHVDLAVDGIHCAACIHTIEHDLLAVPGVEGVRVNFTLRRVGVDWRSGEIEPGTLLDRLAAIGYPARPYSMGAEEAEVARAMKRLIRSLAVAGFAAMNIMLLSVSVWSGNAADITPETRDFFHWFSALIALPAVAYAGLPFFESAWRALKGRRINMDVPISLGVLMAVGVSLYETAISARIVYFESAVMLLFFLLAGRALDLAMRRKTRALAGNLAALRSETAERIGPDGTIRTVPAAGLEVGDTILVRPGDRVAADGTVVAGNSAVDQSLVTGETMPKAVFPGDTVYAGSLNQRGALTVTVTAPEGNALVDAVQKLLDKSVEARSRRVQLTDRAARLYAPVVHLTALLAAIGWLVAGAGIHQSLLVATAVLIITCPCAIALAIPAVQVAASGALFRSGIFLNAGDAIERLAEVDTVVFDKTGTLTLPDSGTVNTAEIPPPLLDIATRMALSSRHPLAAALAVHAGGKTPFADAVETPGRGVTATVDGVETRLGSPSFCGVAADNRPGESVLALRYGEASAVFRLRQRLRPGAVETIAALRRRGLTCAILSGDSAEAVAPVAAALQITIAEADCRPADKVARLEALAAKGHRVAFVGDGLNDAPSLTAAHVSLSPISAVDLAQAHADTVFLGDALSPVARAIDIAVRARRLMSQNLWFAVIFNTVAVPLAIAGLATPLVAALAMSASSVAVTINALRALPRAPSPPALAEHAAMAPA
ncbi:MAG TPA: heavy metal translocating P-type ATPase [Bauldia sp.]|nr:heavy metal translocating P-type ATPase [Bauldia sp.]